MNKKKGEVDEKDVRQNSRDALYDKIVKFNPIYTVGDVAGIFGVGAKKVRDWMDEGKLGYIVIGKTAGRRGTSEKRQSTGWQVIDFLEYMESQNGKAKEEEELL